ncbi:hypothetical protein [uncultured Chitinophaga sp.]|uniref:hypothetical protein n=1 Tax=uncultured Chitinophaga sp. TaxID=339340 RepID=UPI0025EC5DAE|nr:hypothetical protein [uncultured Chitinophaga sp.]
MRVNILALFILLATTLLISCSKGGESSPNYTYTYKLAGPAATVVQVQYTPTMTDPNMTEVPDDLEYEEQVTPPWEKTVTLHKNIAGAGFSASVSNGVPGAKYTISILSKDGNVLKTGDFTLDEYGDGALLLNYYRN